MKQATGYEVFEVPVLEIFMDKEFNCRPFIPLTAVRDLASSIRDSRLETPIIVQPVEDVPESVVIPESFKWRVVAGHRRFTACTKLLKWSHIPAIIRPGLTDADARLLNFTENLDRQDLNLFEEAVAIDRIFTDESTSVIQSRLNRGYRWVRARIELLSLPEGVQQAAAAGIVTQWDLTQYIEQGRPDSFFDDLQQRKADGYSSRSIHHSGKGYGVRKKSEIQRMIAELLTSQFPVTAPRALAWAVNTITTEDLRADLEGRSGKAP